MTTVELKEKPKKARFALKAACDFDYLAEKLKMTLSSGHVVTKPRSIKTSFRKKIISQTAFGTDFPVVKPPNGLMFEISFSNTLIDFFGFSTDRTFTVIYEFISTNGSTYQSTFTMTLPVVQQSELHFKAPGTRFPGDDLRSVCAQGFQMNESNTDEQVRMVILLEEFKLMPIAERYKAYGFVTMLDYFIDIENSFELDLVNKFNINNAHVQKLSAIQYKIEVSQLFW